MSSLTFRIATLWLKHFALICLVMGIEGVLVWRSGFRFRSRQSIEKAWIPGSGLSIDRDECWAAAKVYIRQRNNQAGATAASILLDLNGSDIKRLELGGVQPVCLALSPDAEWLAVAGGDRFLHIFRGPCDGAPTFFAKLETGHLQIHGLVFSPDGRYLASLGHQETIVWDWQEESIVWRIENDQRPRSPLCFSSDGELLAAADVDGRLCAWEVATGRQDHVIVGDSSDLIDLVWSDQKRAWICIHSDGEHVTTYGCDGNSRRTMWQLGMASVWSSSVTREGLALVSIESGRATIQVVELRSGKVLDQVETGAHFLSGVHLSESGALYSWCEQGSIQARPLENRGRHWSESLVEVASRSDWLSLQSQHAFD